MTSTEKAMREYEAVNERHARLVLSVYWKRYNWAEIEEKRRYRESLKELKQDIKENLCYNMPKSKAQKDMEWKL